MSNKKIIDNKDLFQKLAYCINKTAYDLRQYLKENPNETNNAIMFLKGDFINTALKDYVIKDDVIFIPFNRNFWKGRIIADIKNHITYSIMTEQTLSRVIKNKNSKTLHYLIILINMENKDCISKCEQITLNGVESDFDTDALEQEFENITNKLINLEEGYKHYVVSYKMNKYLVENIEIKLFDKDFNIVDKLSLMEYIKLDFSQLTNNEFVQDANKDSKVDKRNLVSIKSGVKPKLRELKKKGLI